MMETSGPGSETPDEPQGKDLSGSRVDQARRLWQSPQVEQALAAADIECSIAHVKTLGECGVVPREVARQVQTVLEELAGEVCQGKSVIAATDEDMYAGLYRRVFEKAGSNSDILKLGRSDDERTATNIRIWLRSASVDVGQRLVNLRQVLLRLAERDNEVVMPGYSHMQPAGPILLATWWLANEARFRRDFSRFIDVYKRIGMLPLGVSAAENSGMTIDRTLTARLLGFESLCENIIDAVCDRDYVIEFAAFAASVGVHISQLAADLLLWASHEYGFVRLPRGFVFRDQRMPMRRNVELLEILRARPAALTGRLNEFLMQMKGLPLSYNQDLQESLPGILDVIDNLNFSLELAAELIPALRFDQSRMRELSNADLNNASNAIDFLIDRGLTTDKASNIAEALLIYAKERNKQLYDLTLNEWIQFSPAFNEEIFQFVENSSSEQSYFAHGAESLRATHAAQNANNSLTSDSQTITNLAAKRLNCRELGAYSG
jgi:argininosuccinate lyase